jgi:recombination protein RecA
MQKAFLDALAKRFGKDVLVPGANFESNSFRVSTGSFGLDWATGGGWPRGRLNLLCGPYSSGKSFLVYKSIAQVSKEGKQVAWLDVEGAFDTDWAKKCGADVSNILVNRGETAEEVLDLCEALAESGEVSAIVLDSIAALVPKDEKEESLEQWQMGLGARLLNKSMRKLQSALNKASRGKSEPPLVFFINQLRMKIGVVYGSPETLPYGEGQKYFAQVRADVRGEGVDEDGMAQSRVKFEKNKTAPPKKVWSVQFYTEGPNAGKLNSSFDLMRFAEDCGLIQRNKGWLTVAGNAKNFREKDIFEMFVNDTTFREEVIALATSSWPTGLLRHPASTYEWL